MRLVASYISKSAQRNFHVSTSHARRSEYETCMSPKTSLDTPSPLESILFQGQKLFSKILAGQVNTISLKITFSSSGRDENPLILRDLKEWLICVLKKGTPSMCKLKEAPHSLLTHR